jgi:tRNA(Ile)-lysidine synthase
MIADVLRTIGRRGLCGTADRVAVAVSGGADSVALALVLHELQAQGGPQVAGLIHLNHGLRGADADLDEAFCRALAARLGVPIEVSRVDARAAARAHHCSIEVAARRARYTFFRAAAAALDATRVATGHTLDDQAETVLLRLLRGAGLRGAAGIPPRRAIFIRPLIDVRRAAVRGWLTTRGEPWRDDASNADATIPRNRIRHELLPVVERIAPGGIAALARFAGLAADDEAALEARAIEMLPALVLSEEGTPEAGTSITLDARGLRDARPALARRVIRLLAGRVAPETTLAAGQLETVRTLAVADTRDSAVDLPGLRVVRAGASLVLAAAAGRTPRRGREVASYCRSLDVPGSVSIPEVGVSISARREAAPPDSLSEERARGPRAVLQAACVALPLRVRTWRPGDRIRPLGAPGRRKLQDLFVDRRIPQAERHRVPVVEDAAGRIVWVAGVTLAEEARVTAPEGAVVILELRKDQ